MAHLRSIFAFAIVLRPFNFPMAKMYWQKCFISFYIINRGKWLWSPANFKRANNDAKICVGRSMTVHNLLFCAYTLCMNYVTKTFLLVSCSIRRKQLLWLVHGQGQKTEQKHTTKKFVGIYNHSCLSVNSDTMNEQSHPNKFSVHLECLRWLTVKFFQM